MSPFRAGAFRARCRSSVMNICMLVLNNVTRDHRVMREAATLQNLGHSVTALGIVENNADLLFETTIEGVAIRRVPWKARARRAGFWNLFFTAIVSLVALSLLAFGLRTAGPAVFIILFLCAILAALGVLLLAGRNIIAGYQILTDEERGRIARLIIPEKETARIEGFPRPRCRLPAWLPEWLLATALAPVAPFSDGLGKFAVSWLQAVLLSDAAIGLAPHVIHAHDCSALPAAMRVKRKLGIPVIYDAHELYEDAVRAPGVGEYYAYLHRKYLARVDRIITVNDSIAQFYRYAYPEAKQAIVIRNAVLRRPLPPYDGRLHRTAGVPPSQKILLYQGGFSEGRGLPSLVRMAASLPANWTLAMMGWGPLADELERIASEDTASAKVKFLPAVPQGSLLEWTSGATIGVIPYENMVLNHWFCSPNKLWEFPAAGVPLLVQPFPELRRVVETWRCGWMLSFDSARSGLADFCERLTEDEIQTARENCHAFIDADCWQNASAPRLAEIYISLAAGR